MITTDHFYEKIYRRLSAKKFMLRHLQIMFVKNPR